MKSYEGALEFENVLVFVLSIRQKNSLKPSQRGGGAIIKTKLETKSQDLAEIFEGVKLMSHQT